MKTILFLLLSFCFIGCKDPHRYFQINYRIDEIASGQQNYGAFWFEMDQFPSKNYIDSSVYSVLPKDKCCYDHLVVTNIYEFKDSNDFNNYGKNYNGSFSEVENKDSVCSPSQFTVTDNADLWFKEIDKTHTLVKGGDTLNININDIKLGGPIQHDTKISGRGFYDSIKKQK